MKHTELVGAMLRTPQGFVAFAIGLLLVASTVVAVLSGQWVVAAVLVVVELVYAYVLLRAYAYIFFFVSIFVYIVKMIFGIK